MPLLGEPAACPHGNPIPGSGSPNLKSGRNLDVVDKGNEIMVKRTTEQASRLREYSYRNGILPGARHICPNSASAGASDLRAGDQTAGAGMQAAHWIFLQPVA